MHIFTIFVAKWIFSNFCNSILYPIKAFGQLIPTYLVVSDVQNPWKHYYLILTCLEYNNIISTYRCCTMYYELGVEVRAIWAVDIRLSKSVLELLTRIAGAPSSVLAPALYFCCICMLVHPFRLHRFLFHSLFVDFSSNACHTFQWRTVWIII